MKKPLLVFFLFSFFLAFSSLAEDNPSTGKIRGKVTDRESNAPIPFVSVYIEGLPIGGTTDENGEYEIMDVPVGIHNIGFTLVGYRPLMKTNISVSTNRTTELSIRLEQEVIQMETIVVKTKPYYFEKDPEAEVSGKTIDREEIMNFSGSVLDIQRVVQILPSVVSGSDQMNEIIVRGGNYGENLFIMDGIEIPNPNHFAQQGIGGGPISMLRAEFIQDVSFMAGAFPARYGDKASSVMDITLRKGTKDRMLTNLDMGMAGIGLMAEGPLGEKGSFLLSARKSFLDLIISSTGLTAVPQYYNLQGKFTFNIFENHTLMWNSVYANDHIKIVDQEEDIGYNQGVENVDSGGDQIINGITLKSLWTGNFYSVGVLSVIKNTYDIDVWENVHNTRMPQFKNSSTEQETQLKYDLSWQVGKSELSGGFSLKQAHFDHNVLADIDTVFTYDTSFTNAKDDTIIGTRWIYPQWKDDNNVNSLKSAVHAQIRFTPFDRLNLRVGGRYEHFSYNGKGHFAPRLGLRLKIARDFWFNGAYGIHYQSPAYISLTSHDDNKNLDYYHTEQSVLGIEWYPWTDTRLTLEGYTKRYADVPVNESWTRKPYDPWYSSNGKLVNAAKGHSYGIEFFIQKKMSGSFMYIVSYSNYRAYFKDPRTGDKRPWDFDHRNVFTTSVSKRWTLINSGWYKNMKTKFWYKTLSWLLPFGDEVMLSTKWRYVGGRPYTQPNYYRKYHIWLTENNTIFNDRRIPDYHRLDIRLDRRFYFKGWSLVVYFDFINFYNRKNVWSYSRNEFGEVENIYQFTTLPIGGFNVEF